MRTDRSMVPEVRRLIVKLNSHTRLSESDTELLLTLPLRVENIRGRRDIFIEGQVSVESCLLFSGFLCRSKTAAGGERQILSFHAPGELPDLQTLYLKRMDHTLSALSDCRIGFVSHKDLHSRIAISPTLATALWRETLLDAVIFREWILNLGRKNAQARLAHLICELYVRLGLVDIAKDFQFEMPITQSTIADALGLSSVHVNRVMQDLRQRQLIETDGTTIKILDWTALTAEGEFDASYLHFE